MVAFTVPGELPSEYSRDTNRMCGVGYFESVQWILFTVLMLTSLYRNWHFELFHGWKLFSKISTDLRYCDEHRHLFYRIYRPVFTGVRYFESIHGWRCHGPINFPAYTEIGRWADAGHQIFDIIILLIRSCSDGKYENTFWREKRNIERHLQW